MSRPDHFGLIGGAPSDANAETLKALDGYDRGHRKNPVVPGASNVWGVGCAETAEAVIDYAISWDDIAADEAWPSRMLAEAGVERGDLVFFSYIYSRSGQTWPWLKASFDMGAKIATGMPTQWDAYRLEMYCRLFPVKLIFGLTPEVLDGLQGADCKLETVFGKVARVIAFGAAWHRLRALGMAPWRLHWLGPIIAIDPCDGGGARFDHTQWTLEEDSGCLLISNRNPRLAAFERAALGVRGSVERVSGEPRLFVAD